MASTDKTKFKIIETSKQANVDIISDKVQLPADSADHVLVATVPIVSGSGQTTTTQTVNVPAQNTMFFYLTENYGNQFRAWWETTDNIFDSYDFSNGISWFYAGSQSSYWFIDRINVLNLEFTDGSYIIIKHGGNNNLRLEYRDGSAGTVKYFDTPQYSELFSLHGSQTTDLIDQTGGNGFEPSANQAEAYVKKASYIGPNGYKVTASGSYNTQSQSINTFSVTANNGAAWTDLDFSSKTISKSSLLKTGTASNIRLDLLAFASKELTFNSLLVKYDETGTEITNGTFAVFDAFSKDYDRFFLFGNGAYDNIPLNTNPYNTNAAISNILVKSHDGTVNLDFKAINYSTNPVTELTTYYYVYKERTDLPNFINSSGTTQREITTLSASSVVAGVVNVELETSPDGENWCPAQIKQVTASGGGGSTAVTTIVPNEKYVNLEPAGTNLKDRHARGSLSFNDDGSTAGYELGTRDMMHQHIDVGKSFNFSQWWKTSYLPTSTYKPVLFRHGGYDDFENTKVIQLTDAVTQNLCEPKPGFTNEYALAGTTSTILSSSGTNTNEGISGSNSTYNVANKSITFDKDWSFTARLFVAGGTSGAINDVVTLLYTRNTGVTHRFKIQVYPYLSSWRVWIGDSPSAGSYGVPFAQYTNSGNIGTRTTSNVDSWYIVSFSYTASTGAEFRIIRESDGGSEVFLPFTNGVAGADWSSDTFPTANLSVAYMAAPIADKIKIDQMVYYSKPLSLTEIQELVANGQINDPLGTSFASSVMSYRRFGDGPNDTFSTKVTDIMGSAQDMNISNGTFAALATNDTGYATTSLTNNQNLFTAASNLSISGWFKTTDTGTLFSNTEGAAATGLKLDVSGSSITASYLGTVNTTSVSGTFNDGNWHHLVFISSPGSQLIVVDNTSSGTSNHTLTDSELKGSNGFTLLGDGQNNANAISPASTDSSKLNATLSNWSLHSEVLDQYAIAQLYSNGHVRNIKNLPNVNSANIAAWWQLNDQTTPEQDLIGTTNLLYQDGNSDTLLSKQIAATGATLIEKSINGNALTLSITKNFDFVNEVWVTDASGDNAICMSLNGFEDQAEYFVLWKCSQTFGTETINMCDGNWHNLILCYRGEADTGAVAEGDTVKFGPQASSDFNFTICFDGISLDGINGSIGADFIGGLGANLVLDSTATKNAGFTIYNRHLKYESSNNEEVYKPHCQFAPGIYDWSGNALDDPNNFQGQVDETSFHSDNWWYDSSGQIFENDFSNEKAYTLYGRTNALDNRGDGTDYPRGVPYGLLNPEYLVSTSDINDIAGSNQFINPVRKGDTQPWDSQVSTGGLEGWWRWGDISTDCSRDINDAKDDANGADYRDLKVKALSDQNTHDIAFLNTSDSIYLAPASTGGGGSVSASYVSVILEDLSNLIGTATCTAKHLSAQVLQYLRIKLTGAGTCDIGDDKLKVEVHYKKRRMK